MALMHNSRIMHQHFDLLADHADMASVEGKDTPAGAPEGNAGRAQGVGHRPRNSQTRPLPLPPFIIGAKLKNYALLPTQSFFNGLRGAEVWCEWSLPASTLQVALSAFGRNSPEIRTGPIQVSWFSFFKKDLLA